MTPLILAKWEELLRDSQDRPDLLTLWASIRTDPDPENALVTVAAMYYQSLRSQDWTEVEILG